MQKNVSYRHIAASKLAWPLGIYECLHLLLLKRSMCRGIRASDLYRLFQSDHLAGLASAHARLTSFDFEWMQNIEVNKLCKVDSFEAALVCCNKCNGGMCVCVEWEWGIVWVCVCYNNICSVGVQNAKVGFEIFLKSLSLALSQLSFTAEGLINGRKNSL